MHRQARGARHCPKVTCKGLLSLRLILNPWTAVKVPRLRVHRASIPRQQPIGCDQKGHSIRAKDALRINASNGSQRAYEPCPWNIMDFASLEAKKAHVGAP